MRIELERNSKTDQREKYIDYLVIEFLNATGSKIAQKGSKDFKKEFLAWTKERRDMGNLYTGLVEYMNIDYLTPFAAEVGKGINDTIVYDKNTTVITPFPYQMPGNKKINNKIIERELKVKNDGSSIYVPKELPIHTFITHNPYNMEQIKNWEHLFNCGLLNVALGIFGNCSDKDREAKEKMLKAIIDALEVSYKEEAFTEKDMYGHIITTGQSRLVKTKRK